ncbi:hypothetical protein [Polyangium fumosum]|uniref:Outer membrane protein beta-barrel domain-containing protein n=1 Tax=Polyangium fumosum TaxID=889272 RepID=A0A4U1JM00_9BACT|nr:hypothetical protein [Polyangium fumosum]TKD13018.1 hypothetical protein E8A74_00180 [Polyangium fumosum]
MRMTLVLPSLLLALAASTTTSTPARADDAPDVDVDDLRTFKRRRFPLLPTAGLVLGPSFGAPTTRFFGGAWLGAAHYPMSGPHTFFWSLAGALEVQSAGDEIALPWGVDLRLGSAWFSTTRRYLLQGTVYLLGGYRFASALDSGSARFGIGASSPAFFLGAVRTIFFPVPSTLELVGVLPRDAPARFELRFGWSY